jgi:predicted membrane channel-forming protein YqfA (hemolysin III family)
VRYTLKREKECEFAFPLFCLRERAQGVGVTVEKWALAASVLFAGPWSGLLAMLTTILHPMLGAMNGRDFRTFMEAFLRVARKAWFNYVCSIGMGVGPIVALIALWDDRSGAPFVLTAIGLALVLAGVYIVANVWKEPHYDAMLAWDPDAMPADWEAGRRRYFTINWINAVSTWAAFILFLAALLSL